MDNVWKKLNQPIIALAPMAGWTDSPMRQISKQFGADLVYSEMISSDGIYYDIQSSKEKRPSLQLAQFTQLERPIITQIFGNDPAKMSFAARYLEEHYQPDGIDINMGCPARKVNKNFHGASLIKDPDLAVKIIKEVKRVVNTPLSVKTRLGWNDKKEIFQFAKRLKEAGIDALAVHGRTKTQEYQGQADWEIIRDLKTQINIPLLASGDMFEPEQIVSFIQSSGIDGVLIARGAMGNPWIFQQIKAMLNNHPFSEPSFEETNRVVLEHAKLIPEGEKSFIEFRKHLIHYYKGFSGAKKLREQLLKISSVKELGEVLESWPKE